MVQSHLDLKTCGLFIRPLKVMLINGGMNVKCLVGKAFGL